MRDLLCQGREEARCPSVRDVFSPLSACKRRVVFVFQSKGTEGASIYAITHFL